MCGVGGDVDGDGDGDVGGDVGDVASSRGRV